MSLELRMAAKNGNLNLVSSLIKEGIDVDGTEEGNNYPPLNLASAEGHIEVVKILIKHNANINKTDNCGYGYTPLHVACKKGYIEIAKLLIKKGADINATDSNGQAPLHLVCKRNYIDIANLLIESKADLNIVDKYQILPLLLAVAHGQTEIIELLQKKGAELFPSGDNEGIWFDLVRKCDTQTVKLIIKAVLLKNLEEKKPDSIQQHEALSAYWNEYKIKLHSEILSLKTVIFYRASLFDFYTSATVNKLATLSRNKETQNIIAKADFIEKYPFFGNEIKHNFKKGFARTKLTDRIIGNLYPIAQRENIRLTGVEDIDRKILGYLNTHDLESLETASSHPIKPMPSG